MKFKLIICAGMLSLLLTACTASPQQSAEFIGSEQAKVSALSKAGVRESEALFSDVTLENRNGLDYYSIDFTTDDHEYEYDIDALTGTIIEEKSKALKPAASSSNSAQSDTSSQKTSSTTSVDDMSSATASAKSATDSSKQTASGTTIGEAKAKSVALAHAKLSEKDVSFAKTKLEYDDGKQIYDVEFYTADYKEYDYEIDAYTGKVLSYDFDADSYTPPTASGTTISADSAKKTALSQVPGATLFDIKKFETDYDDGRLTYEGKIIYNNYEYEFEIDGYSGAINSWESEPA